MSYIFDYFRRHEFKALKITKPYQNSKPEQFSELNNTLLLTKEDGGLRKFEERDF
jgi:hypothetical protein